jgi:hypothetical protein
MDDDVRRELDELQRRVAELEAMLTRLVGVTPIDPTPSRTDPLRHPQPPPPGDFPRST